MVQNLTDDQKREISAISVGTIGKLMRGNCVGDLSCVSDMMDRAEADGWGADEREARPGGIPDLEGCLDQSKHGDRPTDRSSLERCV
jgi:hypothetical protein